MKLREALETVPPVVRAWALVSIEYDDEERPLLDLLASVDADDIAWLDETAHIELQDRPLTIYGPREDDVCIKRHTHISTAEDDIFVVW